MKSAEAVSLGQGASRSGHGAAVPPKAVEREPTSALHRSVTAEDRERMIAETAYYRAERRGFASGHQLDDWLDAEREVDRLITETETDKEMN